MLSGSEIFTICSNQGIVACINVSYLPVLYAFALGFFPALIWLMLWLNEDHKRPEPPKRLASAFFLGSIAAIGAWGIPMLVLNVLNLEVSETLFLSSYFIIGIVALEEILKFSAGLPAIMSKDDDEPIDAMIYLIVAALGFVALENTLYILSESWGVGYQAGTMLAMDRFVGASLLHVLASATIGIGYASTFFARKWRVPAVVLCITLAVSLHSLFNLLIIRSANTGLNEYIALAFMVVWLGIIALLFAFHIIKKQNKK